MYLVLKNSFLIAIFSFYNLLSIFFLTLYSYIYHTVFTGKLKATIAKLFFKICFQALCLNVEHVFKC